MEGEARIRLVDPRFQHGGSIERGKVSLEVVHISSPSLLNKKKS
jgi:hypothetical protein